MTRKLAPKPDPGKPGAFLSNRARAKAGMNRRILASRWGLLGKRVEHKAHASGAAAVFADPRFTSQHCRACGHTATGGGVSRLGICGLQAGEDGTCC